ncbi:MAG: hypothetical protein L6275_02295 [Candidatus Portnoybacteria bacterium]|nr:hypothetical protein [Candidatus Portnoybacteria bacterium]
MKQKIKPKADFLFELSWEVCNKVGGIYAVITSKASQMVGYYGDNYYLIGPYVAAKAKGQFREEAPPENFRVAFSDLEKEGIKCHFGRWLIEGEPKTILVDYTHVWGQANEIKRQLWENYQIDTLNSNVDFDEPMVWSWASGKLIERLADCLKGKKIASQFHEWLCAAGLLYLKNNKVKTGLVFTTHATCLGRTLASADFPLYSMLDKINPDEEVYRRGIHSKHQIEKAAAQQSDIFTTVSKITGLEAEHLLGRKPDVLTYNGLDISKFSSFEENIIKHRIQRNRIREFALYYFLPYCAIDIKNTLFYFISGRYEFRNKGIDFFIKSLGELNQRLKKENNKKNIIAFIWAPADVREIKPEILESREIYRDIKDFFEEVSEEAKESILYALAGGKEIAQNELFSESFLREIKKKIMKLKRSGLPPTCTHNLANPDDIILKTLKEAGLENQEEDKVKVIFYPIYLTGDDGLLNLNYHESIQGAHLGAFPSFYEPWGYTPLETAALGVASITTDLSGFGIFSQDEIKDKAYPGMFILERFNKKDEAAIKSLTDLFYSFSQFSHKEREENKIRAREMAAGADWGILAARYIEAHNQSIKKAL